VNPGWGHAAIGIAALLVLAGATLTFVGVPARRAVFVAAGRALVQLLLIGALVRAVFHEPLLVVVLFALMLVSAALVSIGRIRGVERARIAVVAASCSSSSLVVGICFAVPVVSRDSRDLVAIGGIVIGGSMTACTLSGRAFLAGARARREEIEAWLALGATMRQACLDIARTAIGDSLVPALDQTRTVGLVTLPGTFVGALLGGASPADAARVQLVILVAVLTAQVIASSLLLFFVGAPRQLPGPPGMAIAAPGRLTMRVRTR
jgi:putative ABC transport system permease protein